MSGTAHAREMMIVSTVADPGDPTGWTVVVGEHHRTLCQQVTAPTSIEAEVQVWEEFLRRFPEY